jgi:hypothetical protein
VRAQVKADPVGIGFAIDPRLIAVVTSAGPQIGKKHSRHLDKIDGLASADAVFMLLYEGDSGCCAMV